MGWLLIPRTSPHLYPAFPKQFDEGGRYLFGVLIYSTEFVSLLRHQDLWKWNKVFQPKLEKCIAKQGQVRHCDARGTRTPAS
jgi:hypothetical protein